MSEGSRSLEARAYIQRVTAKKKQARQNTRRKRQRLEAAQIRARNSAPIY